MSDCGYVFVTITFDLRVNEAESWLTRSLTLLFACFFRVTVKNHGLKMTWRWIRCLFPLFGRFCRQAVHRRRLVLVADLWVGVLSFAGARSLSSPDQDRGQRQLCAALEQSFHTAPLCLNRDSAHSWNYVHHRSDRFFIIF